LSYELLLRWSRRHMHEYKEQQNDWRKYSYSKESMTCAKAETSGWSTWLWFLNEQRNTNVLVCKMQRYKRHSDTIRPSQSLVVPSE
jgi:hypothetical protein